MNKNNLIKLLIILIFLPQLLLGGESGDELPGEEIELLEKIEQQKDVTAETEIIPEDESIEELLEPGIETENNLPENRLTNIFGQAFLEKINITDIKIIGECIPLNSQGKCFAVMPKRASKHFDNYYFYTNANNKVNAIIVFDKKKFTNVSKCKIKLNEWINYFENFDLHKKSSESNNMSIIYNDKPQQKFLEIFGSCYQERFRDIESNFILKFYKSI